MPKPLNYLSIQHYIYARTSAGDLSRQSGGSKKIMNFPARQLTGRGIISDIIIFYFAATPNGGFSTSGGECTQLHSSAHWRIHLTVIRSEIMNRKYGQFSAEGREFVIKDVRTPTPWINYIYNDQYFATISNNGGGISYIGNPLHGRITRWRINDVPSDRPGKYIYFRDHESGVVWSATWQPVGLNYKAYSVRHGFGYSVMTCRLDDVHSEVTYFVPRSDTREIWQLNIRNLSSRTRYLSTWGYVEFALGHALIDQINQCDDQHFNRVYFDPEFNSLFATKTYWVTGSLGTQQQENQEWDHWAYFTMSEPADAYETMRERFIGPYRSESNPLAFEEGGLSCRDTDFGNTVGVLEKSITLAPGEEQTLLFSLGVLPKEDFQHHRHEISRCMTAKSADRELQEIRLHWTRHFNAVQAEIPDREVSHFQNYWNAYQARTAFDVRRVASYYYWGIGRGWGFRDTAQDIVGISISDHAAARERILLLCRQMFPSGVVYHHFYQDKQGEITRHCDDPFWFILAVTEYIRETDDTDLMETVQPFADRSEGSVLAHLMAVMNFAENNLGPHGLPVFGRGDWNDTLDYVGGESGGESVWGAMFYTAMLSRLADLLEYCGYSSELLPVRALKTRLKKSVNDACWDGDWYIRAFTGSGHPIGSRQNDTGKIYLNTQSWAVISGIADKERARRALDSVRKHLDSEYGPKICAPAYRRVDPSIGLITRCVPGKKENGAVFLHPAAWLIQAACMMNRGKEAWTTYRKLLPFVHDPDLFQAEPYVYSQYVTSDEHEYPGRASHSWQTGTAAWMYRIFIDYIIGVRAVFDGLLIDPHFPEDWSGTAVTRTFRGTVYRIRIDRDSKLRPGALIILCDNQPIKGSRVPVFKKDCCQVDVKWGGEADQTDSPIRLHRTEPPEFDPKRKQI